MDSNVHMACRCVFVWPAFSLALILFDQPISAKILVTSSVWLGHVRGVEQCRPTCQAVKITASCTNRCRSAGNDGEPTGDVETTSCTRSLSGRMHSKASSERTTLCHGESVQMCFCDGLQSIQEDALLLAVLGFKVLDGYVCHPAQVTILSYRCRTRNVWTQITILGMRLRRWDDICFFFLGRTRKEGIHLL